MSASNPRFLDLLIEFSENNHCSVYFAHLQNTLRDLATKCNMSEVLQFQKINHILGDIYTEHQLLESDYKTVSTSIKEMMTEFSVMLEQCKNDREQLVKVSLDRQDLIKKLKESNETALSLLKENEAYQYSISKLKEINSLLNEKQEVLQSQIQNSKITVLGMEDYSRISAEYDRLLASNADMRKDLVEISKQTEYLNQVSIPLQIVCSAFQKNPKLRDQIWQLGGSHSNPAAVLQMREKFYEFDFDKMIKQSREL